MLLDSITDDVPVDAGGSGGWDWDWDCDCDCNFSDERLGLETTF